MVSPSIAFLCFLCVLSPFPLLLAQQSYIGKHYSNCKITNNTSSVLGYSCNGRPTCTAYLLFRSRSPYDSVASASHLLTSDPSRLSQLNSVSVTENFPKEKEIIVPVKCACSGELYQANSSYLVVHGDTQFIIANYTYQGLTTCHALLYQNRDKPRILYTGTNLTVPLRCACPTTWQTNAGVKYLLSFALTAGDSVRSVSQRSGVEPQSIMDANKLLGDNQNLFPFTTLLIPFKNRPTIAPSPPPPPPPPSVSASGKISRRRLWILVVAGTSGGALIFLVSFVIFCIFYRRKSGNVDQTAAPVNLEKTPHTSKNTNPEELLATVADICSTLRIYSFEDLQSATENFSASRAIRGSLYQGILNGNPFAIKMVEGDASKEIGLLSRVNHFNILGLLGVSVGQGQCHLVFEYAEKGLLTDCIHDQSESKFLSWTQRVQIALDVSSGLNYLHNYIKPGHVHMDLTSKGVFLTSDYRAKIANFDMVKLAGEGDGRFGATRHITGTKGYMAPEYLENGLFSANVDIYAFGVVILETVSGKKAVIEGERREVLLAEAFIAFMNKEEALEERTEAFIDPLLRGRCPLHLAVLIFKLITSCLSKDPVSRPSMVEIVQFLSKILDASLSWEQSVSESKIEIVSGSAW